MRVALAISAVIHAAVLLWLVLAPASRPFDPAYAKSLVVDLVPQPDDQRAATDQSPNPDLSNPDSPKPPDKLDLPKLPDQPVPAAADAIASPKKRGPAAVDAKAPPKPEAAAAHAKASPRKPEPTAADAKAPPKPELAAADAKAPTKKPAAGGQDQDDAAEAAARLAFMLDAPTNLPTTLAAPPSESKTSLAPDSIARFKAQVRKCFVPLADPPSTPDFATEIRIALKPNGTLAADPEMTFAPAVPNGRLLMDRAKQAVRQCQPYSFLPTDKYADWRIIDLVFSYDGPADAATASAVRRKIFSNR